MPIKYVTRRSPLGPLLVASDRGRVVTVEFGASTATLRRAFSRKNPGAVLATGDRVLARHAAGIIRLMERPGDAGRLPIKPAGTPFQRRVWAALRRIPSGITATYAQIARRIGRRSAVRAVAAACAANPLAVVIPCHRVVRSDGGLSGYRWGTQRKRALLAREARSRA